MKNGVINEKWIGSVIHHCTLQKFINRKPSTNFLPFGDKLVKIGMS